MANKLKTIPARTFGHSVKEKGHLPEFSLDDTQLPAVKGWKTGETYKMVIEVKQIGSRLIEEGNHKGGVRNEFQVVKVMDKTSE